MEKIRVDKNNLLTTLRRNRDAHQDEYDKAVVAFRTRAIEVMEQHLAAARNGDEVKLYVQIPVPEIHTDDYERVIALMEWELATEIVLSEVDFNQYVLNQWGWARTFAANTSSYNNR